MTAAFDKAYAFTRRPDVEGALANVVGDRGGRTMGGVTQAEYDAWRLRHGMKRQLVDLISEQEEHALLYEDYWVPCHCEELPAGLGAAVFDMAVNSGPYNARITLQEALRVKQDGQIGEKTLKAAAESRDAVLDFLRTRAGFYRDEVTARPAQVMFLHGWVNRLLNFQDAYRNGAFA